MQIFQVRPVGPFLASFFWNSLISLPLWVFYIVASLSHQNAQETLNFSTVHSKTGLWALAFLAFLLLPHFSTQSSHLCTSLAGCWDPLVLDLFEPWSGSALFVDGPRYFLFLWVITVISLLILMMLPGKNTFLQPVETPMGVASEPQVTATGGSFGGNSFERIPNFVAAPDLSDEKPPLEQKMAAEHEIH